MKTIQTEVPEQLFTMKKLSIIKRDAENNDVEFWRTKTPEERLSAVEFLREQFYIIQGYDRPPSIIREITIRDSTSENPS
jgi:hypothetical protein